MLRSKSSLFNLKLKTLFFCLFSLILSDLILSDDAEARRRGYSRSRSRSSSYRSSRRRSTSSRNTSRSRRPRGTRRSARSRSKGLNLNVFSSSKPKKRVNRSRPNTSQKRTRRANSRRPRRAKRYASYGSWWLGSSTLKRSWRSNFRPRRRFRRSFFNRHRPIVEVWDPYFLASAATALFWYHHWHDSEIQEALYSDHVLEDAELIKLESKVKEYEVQGIVRDPDYLPEGISPQDAYSSTYIDRERRRHEESSGGLILLFSMIVGLFVGFKFMRD